ncbi:MAG TPA: carboxypeptidase-like regulatory domain-containing protein, partial [Thermoanaerobaculia bacterium]|nr:carboxypeptidase-like regulatory domain-containing protein [Thermoanaerobaculia bacterium]
MKRRPLPIFALLLPALAAGGIALAAPPPSPSAPPISGVVRSVQAPISGALVIFYNLADASLTRASTSADGTFVVSSAPVGVYDLIAYKKGFLPALVRLWHQAAPQQVSSLSIELALAGKSRASNRGNGKATPDFWELRDRLPADVLREIGLADSEEKAAASLARPPAQTNTASTTAAKIGGEMRTTTDVGAGDSSISRAALGLRGGLPNGWAYALKGEYATLSDTRPPADGVTTGNSTGLALEVAPSPLDHVRVTTRRNQVSFGDQGTASLQAHQVMWDRGDEHGTVESAAARYIEEAGLYRATARGTSLFPLASRTLELQGAYARAATETPGLSVAMTYRRREGLGSTSGVASNGTFFPAAPDADLSASASVRLGSRALLEGGVVARYLAGGYGIAPRAMARYELPDGSVLFVRGLYRVAESGTSTGTVMPRVASIDDTNEPASRRSVAAGFEHHGDDGSFRFQASQQK